LGRLGRDDQSQLRMLPVLWHLIVTKRLIIDLDARIDAATVISAVGDRP
jgi:hypothetical protein